MTPWQELPTCIHRHLNSPSLSNRKWWKQEYLLVSTISFTLSILQCSLPAAINLDSSLIQKKKSNSPLVSKKSQKNWTLSYRQDLTFLQLQLPRNSSDIPDLLRTWIITRIKYHKVECSEQNFRQESTYRTSKPWPEMQQLPVLEKQLIPSPKIQVMLRTQMKNSLLCPHFSTQFKESDSSS